MAAPFDVPREPVELVLVPIAPVPDLPEDAAGETRFQIHAIGEVERPGEGDAALGRGDEFAAQQRQLRSERGLETARAGREEALAHRSSRRRVSTSAA